MAIFFANIFWQIFFQSVDVEIPNFTQPVIKLLQDFRTEQHKAAFHSIDHIEVPIEKNQDNGGSFTNNLKKYGNKKNSM